MTAPAPSILVVDDNAITCEVIKRNLDLSGFHTLTANSVDTAVDILDRQPVDLVITDYKMPRQSGLTMIQYVRDHFPAVPVIMLTGYGSISSAVSAMKHGADDYLTKPFTDKELLDAVQLILEKRDEQQIDPDTLYAKAWHKYGIIGTSPAMHSVYAGIEKACQNDATVLISGENGTGKELVARAVHYHHGSRSLNPFIPVNCPGIPATLFESELFGHAKGSFTGAVENRKGFFQAAEKGSLFLDEISELPFELQAKFLRVIQEKEIFRVGESTLHKVDVRIIAATNKNLERMVGTGTFRQDLYFRLNVMNITLPPLRDREDDIISLAKHFALKHAKDLGRSAPEFTDGALDALRAHDWPGNVRELDNLILRCLIMNDSGRIDRPLFPETMKLKLPVSKRRLLSLEEMSRKYAKEVLDQVGGNKTKAIEILKIDRKTLLKKLVPLPHGPGKGQAG